MLLAEGGGGGGYSGSGMESPVDGEGLIWPVMFTLRADTLDTSKITGAADLLRSMGRKTYRNVNQIHGSWKGLRPHYTAPEGEQVYALMDPAKDAAEEFRQRCLDAAGHLDDYATALEGEKQSLATFTAEVEQWRAQVVDGVEVEESEVSTGHAMFDWVPGVGDDLKTVPWYQDTATVEKNEQLLGEYAGFVSRIQGYAVDCHDRINALCLNIPPTEGEHPVEALSTEDVLAYWGPARTEDRSCGESTVTGLGNFAKGTWEGLYTLVGFEPGGWWPDGWSFESLGNTWKGIGNLGLSLVVTTGAFGPLFYGGTHIFGDGYDKWYKDRVDTVIATGGSLIGYDHFSDDPWHKWKDDPVAAGFELVPGLITAVVGTKGAGAATKVGKLGRRGDLDAPGGLPGLPRWLTEGGVRVSRLSPDVDTGRGIDFGDVGNGIDDLTPGPGGRTADGGTPSPSWTGDRTPDGDGGRTPVGTGDRTPDGDGGRTGDRTPEGDGDRTPEGDGDRTPEGDGDRTPVGTGDRTPDGDGDRAPNPDGDRDGNGDRGRNGDTDTDSGTNDGDTDTGANGDGNADGPVPTGDLPKQGEPGSFGYDENGNRLPYANNRPDYAPGQVEDVWRDAMDENGEVWVRNSDGELYRVEWEPGQPRKGVWDMGHTPGAEYRDLRQRYLNHEITKEEFLREYRDPDNYRVEDPHRNQSHVDEASSPNSSANGAAVNPAGAPDAPDRARAVDLDAGDAPGTGVTPDGDALETRTAPDTDTPGNAHNADHGTTGPDANDDVSGSAAADVDTPADPNHDALHRYDDVPEAPADGTPADSPEVERWIDETHELHPELSREDIRALWDYTTNDGYNTMNPALRDPSLMTPEARARIDATEAGLERLPDYDGLTHRGTGLPQDVYDSLTPGGTYADPAFTSTSTDATVAAGFAAGRTNPTVFHVDSSTGANVQPFSAYRGEAEILIPPGTTFDIIDVDDVGGVRHVYLRDPQVTPQTSAAGAETSPRGAVGSAPDSVSADGADDAVMPADTSSDDGKSGAHETGEIANEAVGHLNKPNVHEGIQKHRDREHAEAVVEQTEDLVSRSNNGGHRDGE